MAVEAFLNFYGVVRLGEQTFQRQLERQGLVPKLEKLFLICEAIDLETGDELHQSAVAISKQRNQLVHQKAREFDPERGESQRLGAHVPGAAQEAVAEMKRFFTLFEEVLPEARHLVPPVRSEHA